MHEETQNSVDLKLIMYFDPEDQTFAIWDHNLTAEESSRESDRIRRKGLPAFTVEQRSRHKAEEAEDCGDCPADVEHAINPINAIPGHSEPELGSPKRQV